MTGATYSHDEHDLDLPSDGVREITPAAAPAIDPEHIVPSGDGWMDPATEALPSATIEPNIDLTLHESRVAKLPDPWIHPRPRAPNRLRPCLSNLIGRRSWSFPPRISFSTRPWAMC